jgi:hypothetical protein
MWLSCKKTWLEKSWRDDKVGLENLVFPDCRVDLKTLLDGRVDLIFFPFQGQNCDFFVIINLMILSLSTILLDFIEDFPVTNQKYVCNALRLDDMYASLLDLKYRSPPLRCPIIIGCLYLHSKAFFVLLIHQLIHVLASLPLMIRVQCPSWVVHFSHCYQAWPCPQVWWCLIHHERAEPIIHLLDSLENRSLISCVPPANAHQEVV